MKIVHRYVLSEAVPPFFFGFFFFSLILLVGVLFDLTDLIFLRQAPVFRVLQLVAYVVPSFFDIVVPVSLLFAIVLSFGRLSAHGEILAFQSAGIAPATLQLTGWILAISLTVVSVLFSAQLTPRLNRRYEALYRDIILQKPSLNVPERTFVNLKDGSLYAFEVDPASGELAHIVLYQFFSSFESPFPQVVLARRGLVDENTVVLEEIRTYQFGAAHRLIHQGELERETIHTAGVSSSSTPRQRKASEMTLAQIRRELTAEDTPEERRRTLALDYHTRLALPLATLFLGLLAAPVGIRIKRGDRSLSLGITLMLAIGYYILLLFGSFLARATVVPPLIALWIPNMVTGAAAVWFNLRLAQQ